ncbi:MAG: alpha/beta hydrolase [Ktedonobacteraceae bacterium]|nr:alpha/beta hydrolase [Ktedonobacteraceae bacterium]
MQANEKRITEYLEVAGGRIAFDDTKTVGPLIVCVPGLGDVRASYRFLVPQLVAAGYRVVTMDLRGHGESSVGWSDYSDTAVAGDVVALVRLLNAGPAILIGNSYGGAAVAYAAATEPSAVAGLVLLDAFVRDIPQGAFQRLGVWAVAHMGASAWMSYYKSLYKTTPPADLNDYNKALTANLKQPGRYDAVNAMMVASHAAIEPRLAEIKASTLIVVGSQDPDFPDPAGEARLIGEKLTSVANKQVEMIEGAGHYPHAEKPEQVLAVLLPFLQSLREDAHHDA